MPRFGLLLILLAGVFQAASLFAQDLSQPYVEGQVLVRFAPGAAAADRAATRNALLPTGGRSFDLVPGLELVTTSLDVPQAIAVLSNNPNVLYVEPDYIVQPVSEDPYFYLQWGLENTGQDIRGVLGNADADIDMPEAWAAGAASASTLVAVIDTGTQADHPDLQANVVSGWDFFDDDNDPSDAEGHGTHTAGTIAAVAGNNIGVAGVCPNCQIMPLRFLGPNGGSTSDAIDALNYAVANGATVSNNSWGGGGFSQSLYDAIKNAGDAGHVFVAASGNSGTDTDVFAHYPSSYDLWNIISVAATTNQDQRASFSNWGAVSVDLGAPGRDIASTYMNSEYWWNSGTSMAAPHVAGVVAILQALDTAGNLSPPRDPSCPAWHSEGQTTVERTQGIVDRVLDTVRQDVNNPFLVGLTVTGGVLNAYNAVVGICPPRVAPPPELVVPDKFSAVESETGAASLSWDSVPGATYYIIERREWKAKGRNKGSWVGGKSFFPSSSPFEDGSVVAGPLYGYRIASANSSDTSIMSDPRVEFTLTDGGGGDDSGGPPTCRPKKNCP